MWNVGKLRLAGVLLAAVVALPALSACGGDNGGGTAGKSNSDLLKEAGQNMKAAKSYHFDADINQAGQQIKMSGDIDVTNKASKLNMNASGQTIDLVQVSGQNYLSLDGGKTYTKQDTGTVNVTGFTDMWNSFNTADVDKAKDALKDGNPATETIDGVATKHITADAKALNSLTSSGGSSSSVDSGTMDLWVSTDAKPLVRQLKINGTSNGQQTTGTLKWSKFDENFNIQAPQTP